MAKEIDKIIQSKTAPKSNNVLWDDGNNLKINRRGKWESTGTSVPQEKLDSINFGYYTFASSNVVANWGPFTIKGHETITVDTNTIYTPTYCKFDKEEGGVYRKLYREDHESEVILRSYPIVIRKSRDNTNMTIENESDYIETICLFNYKKQVISNDTHYVEGSIFNDVPLKKNVTVNVGELPPDFDSLLGKPVSIYENCNYQTHSGICIGVTVEWYDDYKSMTAISLLNSLNVEILKIYLDAQYLVTTVSSENKQITVI